MPGRPIFAAVYDVLSRLEDRGEMGRRRGQLLRWARGRVLEVGAGTGANFAHYPSRAVGQVVAVDPDPHMLRRAARAAAMAPVPVILRRGEAEDLPFEDASFDTVVATLVLCTVAEPHAALAEIRRVLRPQGRLLLIEHVRSGSRRGAAWQDRLERPWSLLAGGCHPNRDTAQYVREAGFAFEEYAEEDQGPLAGPARPLIVSVARRP